MQISKNEIIILGARIELARHEFYSYCQLKAPNFYKSDRPHLIELCNELQAFYESDYEVLVINEPPRHGKSRTAGLFIEWVLGKNKQEKVMAGSYNKTLSTMFSKNVRNNIQEEKADIRQIVYSDIFPGTYIKQGDGAMNLWSLEGGYNNYLATSPDSTAMGFGCSLMIIDDLIKSAEEAYNKDVKEKHWNWFTNTMLSRLEEGGKIIIIMTRWATDDLAGKALAHYQEQGAKIKHICTKALQDDGSMLCKEILSRASYEAKKRAMGADIASANYQQEPIDIRGRVYKDIKTYTRLPMDENQQLLTECIIAYTDTADEGTDFLCSIAGHAYQGTGYITGVYYTKEGMEITEPETASFLVKNNVNLGLFESNSGGRGFARNVKRQIWEEYQTQSVVIKWFHQTKNKMARILTNSTFVMNNIYFPQNWKERWPEFYMAITSFQKEGGNKNDDAPDALTGFAEMIQGINLKAQRSQEKQKEKQRRRNYY